MNQYPAILRLPPPSSRTETGLHMITDISVFFIYAYTYNSQLVNLFNLILWKIFIY